LAVIGLTLNPGNANGAPQVKWVRFAAHSVTAQPQQIRLFPPGVSFEMGSFRKSAAPIHPAGGPALPNHPNSPNPGARRNSRTRQPAGPAAEHPPPSRAFSNPEMSLGRAFDSNTRWAWKGNLFPIQDEPEEEVVLGRSGILLSEVLGLRAGDGVQGKGAAIEPPSLGPARSDLRQPVTADS